MMQVQEIIARKSTGTCMTKMGNPLQLRKKLKTLRERVSA
jgi:hypothetical protein